MTTHKITLPYTKPPLTANQRLHWAKKAQLTKALRTTTHWKTHALNLPPQNHITVELHYRPRDNRRRDADNLVPTLKPICDGITDTGIIPDDTPQYMTKKMPTIHPPAPNKQPKLWVEITTQNQQKQEKQWT